MPNGQGGERWQYLSGRDLGSVELRYTATEIQQRRESMEQQSHRATENRMLQEFYNNMTSTTFTVSGDWLYTSPIWDETSTHSTPKPKRPTRPISAIFYPMVNECGY